MVVAETGANARLDAELRGRQQGARFQGREPDGDGADGRTDGRTDVQPARAPRGPGFRERHNGVLSRRRGHTRGCCS